MMLFGVTIFSWVMFGLTIFTCLLMWRWLQTRSEENPKKLMGYICVALLLGIAVTRLLFDDSLIYFLF